MSPKNYGFLSSLSGVITKNTKIITQKIFQVAVKTLKTKKIAKHL